MCIKKQQKTKIQQNNKNNKICQLMYVTKIIRKTFLFDKKSFSNNFCDIS